MPTRHPALPHPAQPAAHVREVRYRAFAVEGDQGTHPDRHQPVAHAALWSAYLDVDVATISVVYPFMPSRASPPSPGPSTRAGEDPGVPFAGQAAAPRRASTPCSRRCTSTSSKQHPGLTSSPRRPLAPDKPQGKDHRAAARARTPESPWWAGRKTPARDGGPDGQATTSSWSSPPTASTGTRPSASSSRSRGPARGLPSRRLRNDGGLPETDCGAVTLVRPDNAEARSPAASSRPPRQRAGISGRRPAASLLRPPARGGSSSVIAQSVDSAGCQTCSTPAAADPARGHTPLPRPAPRRG